MAIDFGTPLFVWGERLVVGGLIGAALLNRSFINPINIAMYSTHTISPLLNCSPDIKSTLVDFSSTFRMVTSKLTNLGFLSFWSNILPNLLRDTLSPYVSLGVSRIYNYFLPQTEEYERRTKSSPVPKMMFMMIFVSIVLLPFNQAGIALLTDFEGKYPTMLSYFAEAISQHGVLYLFRGWPMILALSLMNALLIATASPPPPRPNDTAKAAFIASWQLFKALAIDLVMVPMNALLHRLFMGHPTLSSFAHLKHILTERCPIDLYRSYPLEATMHIAQFSASLLS